MGRQLRILFYTVLFITAAANLHAQAPQPSHMARISEDDDFINIWNDGTDNAYTNGTRLDYFYQPSHPSHFFLNKLFPKAGAGSNNTYGWGIDQIMYTPDGIDDPDYQPTDYPWSCAFVATHTLYSYNPDKKYDFLSETAIGVIGPAALGKQTQTLVHEIINYIKPQGWGHQFSNAFLLNYNFTVEKQFYQAGKWLEVSGGAQAQAGTMRNGLTLYPLIRIGAMSPYYNGFFSQYTSQGRTPKGHPRRQLYFFAKPAAQLVFSNALLQGGIFTTNPNLKPPPASPQNIDSNYTPPAPYPGIHTLVLSITYGAVLTQGNWAISFSQSANSAEMKGLYCHQMGNVTVNFAW